MRPSSRFRIFHPGHALLVSLATVASPLAAATITVTSSADSGTNTLRWAIDQANATDLHDTIAFNISGSGTRVIALESALPAVTKPVTIDGTTQPGVFVTPPIRIDGQNDPEVTDGLEINADGSTVKGLQIVRAAGPGLRLNAANSTVSGNFIGTDGTNDLGNAGAGIQVSGSGNLIGGTAAGAHNVVSGNGGAGIRLLAGASGNQVKGNRIGVDPTGTAAIANGGDGVQVLGDFNALGGAEAGARNLVSGNAYSGIALADGAENNTIVGNRIGTNMDGTAALGNGWGGVWIAGDGNTVGGTVAAAGNLISGNGMSGLVIDASALSNGVYGNRIGTDKDGAAAIPNQGGVGLYGDGNTIGGTTAGARNLISGNAYDGIGIDGSATGNEILGNWIGLDATGTGALGNAGYGMRILGGHDNAIGGAAAGAGNVISGNGRGVSLEPDSHHYTFQGNILGLDPAATAKIQAPSSGLDVFSPGHLIGGTAPGAGNVFAGSGYYGLVLAGGSATDVRVEGNWIGTNAAGAIGLGNTYSGIMISEAFGNTIGGTAPGAGNTIARNGYLGVFVAAGSGNAILGNSIHSNGLLGIDLDPQGPAPNDPFDADAGQNLGQNFPVVTSALLAGDLEIAGFLDSKPDTQYRVELFSNDAFDPTGMGEGRFFLGHVDVTTDPSGHATFSTELAAAGGDLFVTATATDPNGNTSEFSPAIAIGAPQPGQLQIWRDVLLSYEGTPGIEVAIVRSHGVAGTVTVDVDTVNVSAVAPGDFGALDTTLTFAPGEVVKSVFVPLVADGLDEADEKWRMKLANPSGGAALGTQNDILAWLFDSSPEWPLYMVSDAEVVEGDGGTKTLVFTVSLAETDHDLPVNYWTTDGSATQGDDYVAAEGQVVLTAADPSATIEIDVLGDALPEDDEIVYVHLIAEGNSVCWDCTGAGRILDDDGGSDLIFADGFEGGDPFDWSQAVGDS